MYSVVFKILLVHFSFFIFSVSWAKCGSTTYKPGNFVVVESALLPSFGEVLEILVYNISECLFVLQIYNTECFLSHFHAYEVSKTLICHACVPNNFVDYHPLSLYILSGHKKVISCKYYLIQNF